MGYRCTIIFFFWFRLYTTNHIYCDLQEAIQNNNAILKEEVDWWLRPFCYVKWQLEPHYEAW